MKKKAKKRIKALLHFLGFAFVTALIAFNFYLSVGTYGQIKAQQAFNKGYVGCINAKKKPDIKTSTNLP